MAFPDQKIAALMGGVAPTVPGLPGMGGIQDAFKALWAAATPTVRVSETEAAVEVSIDLPDVAEEHTSVSTAGGMLTIKAGRRSKTEQSGPGLRVSRQEVGVFQHSMSLPAGTDPDFTVVRFADGVLTVTLPKSS